jgi:hypothetical protein
MEKNTIAAGPEWPAGLLGTVFFGETVKKKVEAQRIDATQHIGFSKLTILVAGINVMQVGTVFDSS